MPHLDANALTDDPKGMEFLAKVVGRAAAEPAHSTTITVPDASLDLPGAVGADAIRLAVRPTPRRAKKLVPEAA